MKISMLTLILGCAFLATGVQASSGLRSVDECNLALYRSNPWQRSYEIENSRREGAKAEAQMTSLMRAGATSQKTVDALGVERYETLTLSKVLETSGTSADSCEGITSVKEVQVCTTDGVKSACETRCEFSWVGMDCR